MRGQRDGLVAAALKRVASSKVKSKLASLDWA